MGGIIGKLSFEHDETLAVPALEQMLGTLRHRGAVGNGIYIAPGIALGWCGDHRPSITRPAVATTGDDTVRVVADSSLTNAAALRRELEQGGHLVRGRSDADLIAHAYDRWGAACVDHLRGPFACAIWDERQERLLLARDGVGIRPLFFAVLHGHGVIFASEIRALLQDPGVGREWCPQAIDAYLALGYIPAPLTAYQRISKLEPGQRLIVEGRRFRFDQFWDLPASADPSSGSDLEAALDDGLRAAVRSHLVNPDTPATLYSGGRASTAILACAPTGVDAVFVDALDDERDTARALAAARRLGNEPRFELTLPAATAIAPQVAAQLEEPLADPSAISHFAVLVAARAHATSALSGHGAATFWPAPSHRRRAQADPPSGMLWNDHERRGLYTRGFAWQLRDSDPLAWQREMRTEAVGALDPSFYVSARMALPDSTLAIAERVALAAGLDLHLPFLDRDVVDLACRLRRRGDDATAPADPLGALLTRRLPVTLLPATAAQSRRTRANAPRHPWLPSALHAMVPSILLAPRFDGRGIVSRPVVRQLWEDHTTGRTDHSHRLWSLLMLEFWFREFFDGGAAADEPFEYAILRVA